MGALNIKTFEPFSKNPSISKIFREIGYADELGSGMRNSYKYTRLYSGAEPEFIEGDIFKIIIPLSNNAMTKVGPGVTDNSAKPPKKTAELKPPKKTAEKRIPQKTLQHRGKILELMSDNEWHRVPELCEMMSLSDRRLREILQGMVAEGIVEDDGQTKGKKYKIIALLEEREGKE